MSASELKALSDEALIHRMLTRERELVRARFEHSQNQLENTSTLRVIRKDIARLQTEATSREQANSLAKGALSARYRSSFGGGASPAAAPVEKGSFLKDLVDRISTQE